MNKIFVTSFIALLQSLVFTQSNDLVTPVSIINAFPMMAMSAFVLIMNVYGYLSWVKDFRQS